MSTLISRLVRAKLMPLDKGSYFSEELLGYAVFDMALNDAYGPPMPASATKQMYSHRHTALEYLDGDMPHIRQLGLEPSYVRRVVRLIAKDLALCPA